MQTYTPQGHSGLYASTAPAGVGDRLIAFIIDTFILTAYVIVVGSLFFTLDVEDELVWIIFVVAPLLFYTLLFEILMRGQTPGKRAVNIKVVSLAGNDASMGQYLVRWAFISVGFYFFSGLVAFIVVLTNGKGQRLGDIVAGSKVVKLDQKIVKHNLYVPVFPAARLLSGDDIELIHRALNAEKEFENAQPVAMVSEKVKLMLGVQTHLSATQFLSTIIRDYHSFSSR